MQAPVSEFHTCFLPDRQGWLHVPFVPVAAAGTEDRHTGYVQVVAVILL